MGSHRPAEPEVVPGTASTDLTLLYFAVLCFAVMLQNERFVVTL